MNYELINVHSAVYLYHFTAKAVGYIKTLFRGQLVDVLLEQVVLEVNLLDEQLGVKNIGLINIDVDSIILSQRGVVDIILNGSDVVVDEELLAEHITGEATHTVVNGDDIRIKAGDQIIERIQRRDGTAGRNIYVHTEGGDGIIGVILGESVHRDMAPIKMSVYNFGCIGQSAQIARRVNGILVQLLLGDQHVHRSALRLVILFGDIEDPCTDHFGHIAEYLRQSFGIVLLVDILYIILLLLLSLSITDIVNIEAEGLGQVIKTVKGDLIILQSIIFPFGE